MNEIFFLEFGLGACVAEANNGALSGQNDSARKLLAANAAENLRRACRDQVLILRRVSGIA
jgi:hypothetical protein